MLNNVTICWNNNFKSKIIYWFGDSTYSSLSKILMHIGKHWLILILCNATIYDEGSMLISVTFCWNWLENIQAKMIYWFRHIT